MPEEEPLQAFAPPNIVREAELRLLVTFFEEVKQLGRGLHYRKSRVLGVVDEDRDSSCGYE
jgi:hypothetical protein